MDILNLIGSLRQARARLVATGGFTVGLQGEVPISGYAVSIDPDHNEVWMDTFPTVGSLLGYVFDHEDILSEDGKYFGAWLDVETGRIHLDVITVLDDEDKARAAAMEFGELAVYDLDTQTEIRV